VIVVCSLDRALVPELPAIRKLTLNLPRSRVLNKFTWTKVRCVELGELPERWPPAFAAAPHVRTRTQLQLTKL
jgi:hypothetical protein